jgi:hypothetical protein
MEVYFCHQNQNAKNIGNFTICWNPIILVLIWKVFLNSFHFWVSYITFGDFLKDKPSGGTIIF